MGNLLKKLFGSKSSASKSKKRFDEAMTKINQTAFSATLVATEQKKNPVTKKTADKPVAKKVAKPEVKKPATTKTAPKKVVTAPKKATSKPTTKKPVSKKK
jgi:hypothetical protein